MVLCGPQRGGLLVVIAAAYSVYLHSVSQDNAQTTASTVGAFNGEAGDDRFLGPDAKTFTFLCCDFTESDIHFDPEALRDTLREPLPPKQSLMPPKWLMTSTPEPVKTQPRTPSSHPASQYSSPSATSAAASKAVRSVSSVGASTQQSSLSPSCTAAQGTKQPPLPPPKPVNRGNAAMLGRFC